MKRINILYRRYREIMFRMFLLTASVFILVYFMPTERKFGFEYRKGAPWMHEDLIAPFDFAIQKNESVLKKQRDSLLQSAEVYYRFNNEQFISLDSLFGEYVESRIDEFIATKSLKATDVAELNLLVDSLRMRYSSLLHMGIVDTLVVDKSSPKVVKMIRNNIAQAYTNNLCTKSEVKRQLSEVLVRMRMYNHKLSDFFATIEFTPYLAPTAFYDARTTQDRYDGLVASFSVTSGMIQRGQRIVSRGELITANMFQIIESLRLEYESDRGISSIRNWLILGKVIVISMAMGVLFLFLIYFRREILQKRIKTYFIVFLLLLMVMAAALITKTENINIYVLPIAIMPIIIQIFYDPRLAIFVHMVTIVIIGFIVPNPFEFVFIQFVVGVIAILSLRQMHRRQQIFLAALAVFFTYSLVYSGIVLMREGSIQELDPMQFAWFAGNSLLVLWTYPLIYLFEKTFGFLSDVTLMELADTNHPLLRKLNEAAPGTFQHSMQVANLAEAVIYRIGGNPSLVRTGALYHDIGKMKNPGYFIENQTPNRNPHDKHSFEESAQIIIGHVKHGLKIARQYKLPQPITDFITTHHGDGLVQYFYRSYINEFPDEMVDEMRFRYPGPTPFSKETGVVMMADSVEAASRSLKTINEKTIDDLVDGIVNYIINEDQLRNADLTFRDISVAKDIFKEKLKNIYHARIEYPEDKKAKTESG